MADIQSFVALNAEAFEDLRKAAASGNQEAIDALEKLNTGIDELRDAQADRHIENLSTAFEHLTESTEASRQEFEAILASAEAFVDAFQGGADVVQDDVARALAFIGQVREQLQTIDRDALRLEVHDEGAQALTDALLRLL